MRLTWIYAALLTLLVGAALVPFHLNPDAFMADDAYFYLQVADHIRQGHGSTFHEITQTNGYHPLWMLCCVVGAFISGGDKTVLLQLMAFVQDGLFLASIFLLWRCGQRLELKFFSLGLFVLTLVMVMVGGLRLFESHLSIMLQMAMLLLFLKCKETPDWKNFIWMGVTMGLCMLARMDTVFFCAIIWLALIWQQPRKILLLTLPPCAMLIPYLVDNYVSFGHIVPVSGAIKSTFPNIDLSYYHLGLHGGPVVVTAVLLSACSLMVEQTKKNRQFFAILFFGVVLHALYLAAFSVGSQWYYTTAYITIAFSLMSIATFLSGKLSKAFSVVCSVMTLLAFSFFLVISFLKTQYHFSVTLVFKGKESLTETSAEMPAAKRLAERLKKEFPQNTAFFMFDYPGMVAYYSGMKIFPFDGLMNDFSYNYHVADLGVSSYAKQKEIDYIIVPVAIAGKEYDRGPLHIWTESGLDTNIEVFTPIGNRKAGRLTLPNDQIIFRMPNPVSPLNKEFPEIALWKIHQA